jgi:hypothetical protein
MSGLWLVGGGGVSSHSCSEQWLGSYVCAFCSLSLSLSLSPEVEGKKRERSVDSAKELGHTSKSWTMLEEKN